MDTTEAHFIQNICWLKEMKYTLKFSFSHHRGNMDEVKDFDDSIC